MPFNGVISYKKKLKSRNFIEGDLIVIKRLFTLVLVSQAESRIDSVANYHFIYLYYLDSCLFFFGMGLEVPFIRSCIL